MSDALHNPVQSGVQRFRGHRRLEEETVIVELGIVDETDVWIVRALDALADGEAE